jgi:HAD superfamily hydrolase (TIGR01509 family)
MTAKALREDASHDARVLICDCDGVLIDSEAVAAQMLVRELSARWPDADVAPVVMPLLGLRIERVLEQTAAALARTLSADDIDAIRRAVEAAARNAPVVDGAEAALEQIALTKACASNSYTGYVEAVLARTGLGRFFGTRLFCADRVARPKPAPDVYIAAADTLGVPRETCLVVEDSVAGVEAARAAGMPVLGFIGGGHATRAQIDALAAAGAQHVFEDMRELPALVDRWLDERLVFARVAADMKGEGSWQA